MDCKDLTVCDFVKHDGTIKIVDAVYLCSVSVHDPSKPWGVALSKLVHVDDIEPIKLTEEILVKNGFCENIHYYPYPTYEYSDDENFVVRIAFPQDCDKTEYNKTFCEIDAKWCDILHIDCEYVHQLQHLMRLCGIEKEIEL